jgi:predicted nucleic acid-binding protein
VIVESLSGRRVYFDANVFIYALNLFPEFAAIVRQVFESVDQRMIAAFSSELTAAELLVKPFKDHDRSAETACRAILFGNEGISVANVSREIIIEAASIRASRTLKLPDAIHLATAKQLNCDVFLTNDARLKNVNVGPEVVLISELTI